jgi:hypothetical protein
MTNLVTCTESAEVEETMMKVLNLLILGLVLFSILIGCKMEKSGKVTVNVTPSIMKEIKAMDLEVVFFTSAKYPIHDFSDIKNESEIGFFGLWNKPRCKLFDIIVLLGLSKSNPCNPPFPSDPHYTPMIGNAYFSTLFERNPNLRLFVTTTSTPGWEEIVKSGGGVQVIFLEK